MDKRQFLASIAVTAVGMTAGCLAAVDRLGDDGDVVLSTSLSGDESETFETGEATEYEVTLTPEGSRAKFGIRQETTAPTSLSSYAATDGESTFGLELNSEATYEVTALGGTFDITIRDRS
ncbi:hypothetical protein [Halopiger xanaduensis]|uniref:Uncharacterized protein n=1 Tax=Halopiger xanaduensis (strain DSM 18323 / JCM 14033 / SH-6) TaxID=797210 RepID=F8D7C0_HALXS|nr:hypothetical protein [Halopiger xanaduensis]AEH37837.1 hypothetical protein Halxa_3225 [Halopiger xanaduensis SH-6]